VARYNEILVGRFARGIQKLFGIKGEAPVASLSGEMMLTHQLQNGAENRYLEGWERFGFMLNSGALAASRSAVRLRNPPGSNIIGVVEKISFILAASDFPTLTLDSGQADFSTFRQGIRFDPRHRANSLLNISSTTNAGVISSNQLFQGATNGTNVIDIIVSEGQELTLLPNDALTVWCAAVNLAISVSFWWRERFLEEPERS
jgi:hypothetical protein